MNNLGFAPKHILIANKIRDDIMSGKLSPGKRLKADTELAMEFNVNKRTVAKGMASLVADGLISRCPGRGSIVIRKDIIEKNSNAVSLIALSHGDIYEKIASQISAGLIKRGMYPICINNIVFNNAIAATNSQMLNGVIEQMMDDNPYGMIVDGDESIPFDLLRRNISRIKNLVFINRYQNTSRIETAKYVLTDYEGGGFRLGSYLIERGHRLINFFPNRELTKVGYVGSPQQQISAGIKRACDKAGVEFISDIPLRLMAGEPLDLVWSDCIASKRIPTAIALPSDSNAYFDVYPVLKKTGFSIPDDISLVGFFNTPWSNRAVPPLTTMSIQEALLGRLAVEMLFSETNETEISIVPELIERDSVISIK
jgi:DNA-binding LacI/PurR family transcriptional regulator